MPAHFIAATKDDGREIRIRVDAIIAVSSSQCRERQRGAGVSANIDCLTVLLENHQSVNLVDISMDELWPFINDAAGVKMQVQRARPARTVDEAA